MKKAQYARWESTDQRFYLSPENCAGYVTPDIRAHFYTNLVTGAWNGLPHDMRANLGIVALKKPIKAFLIETYNSETIWKYKQIYGVAGMDEMKFHGV